MNVVLIGYGKMGREIESILVERGHKVVLIIDENNSGELNRANIADKNAAVAIEFSVPETAYDNIVRCIEAGVPVVSGTTGWLEKLPGVEELCREKNGGFFYASNYSIGVNIFFKVNETLAKMMNRFAQYDVTVEEIHHTHKKDAPSGTAITIAEGIIERLDRKQKWVGHTTIEPEQLEVSAIRRSVVPGIHTVTWESEVDRITINHEAKSRRGFAVGAVMAAEFMCGRKGIYSMDDLLAI